MNCQRLNKSAQYGHRVYTQTQCIVIHSSDSNDQLRHFCRSAAGSGDRCQFRLMVLRKEKKAANNSPPECKYNAKLERRHEETSGDNAEATGVKRASARLWGRRVSASTCARGAHARSAGGAASASTSANLKEPIQGVRGVGHLPAPAPGKHMQGVRGGESLPAPAQEERMQGVPPGGG